MKKLKYLNLILIVWIFSCHNKQINNPNDKDSINSNQSVKLDTISDNDSISDDCVRSIPEPIVIRSKFPNSVFKLKDRIGYETLKFNNGDLLEIQNRGCEYYSILFSIKTSRYIADSNDFKGSCEQFICLLDQIKPAIDCSIDIDRAIDAIKTFENNPDSLRFDSEIIIEEGEIREFASVNRIDRISKNESLFEIVISIGPL
jgi:hypothetical protein